MWRRHGRILLGLLAGSLLVLAVDLLLLGPSAGGWISLDLRGLLVGAYLAFLGLHAAVSSAAVGRWKPQALPRFHASIAALEVVLVIAGLVAWHTVDGARSERRLREQTAKIARLASSFTVQTWRVDPQAQTFTFVLDSKVSAQLSTASATVPSLGTATLREPRAISLGDNSFELAITDTFASDRAVRLQLSILVDTVPLNFDYGGDAEEYVEGNLVARPLPAEVRP